MISFFLAANIRLFCFAYIRGNLLIYKGRVRSSDIIGRHHDKEHPHIHIVFNRVDNNGKTISDKNDRYRSEKICKELTEALKKQGVTMNFKHKGNTNEVQGIRFEKNGYTFNGSKIDRQFSYSKIDFLLKQNEKAQDTHIQKEHNHFQSQSSILGNVGSALGGLFDIQPSGADYYPDEVEFQRQQRLKKKKKRGFRL